MVVAKGTPRVVMVSARRLLVESLAEALERVGGVRFVGTTDDIPFAMDLVLQHHAQVVIVCAQLPKNRAFDLLLNLRSAALNTKVIVLDDGPYLAVAREAIPLGAAGYYTLEDGVTAISDAIHEVMAGCYSLRVDLAQSISYTPDGPRVVADFSASELGRLTPRELDVFTCLAMGDTVKTVAQKLHLSESTVDNHKTRLMRKLNVRRTIDLVKLAIREKLVPS